MRFNGNDYIEYVIKERFKRDYLLKDLLDDEKEGNTRDPTVINIKFKTQSNGVLIFVVGQTGYTMLMVGMKCFYPQIYSSCIYVWSIKMFVFLSNLDKRQKACVHFQRHSVRTPVRVHCRLSCG